MVMGDIWRIDDLGEHIWLLRRSALGFGAALPPGAAPLGAAAAVARLRAWFSEDSGSGGARLAAIAMALAGELAGSGHPDPEWQVRTLAAALRDGRLVAVRLPLPPPAGDVGAEEEEQYGERKATREEKTWIEIALVDDADPPKPIPFKRYRIELPDGSVRQGMLDANGRAMFVGLDPGTCQVSFPDFDDRDWRQL